MALIIIVEDNEQIREAAASYLRLEDHEVLEFPKIGGVLDVLNMKNPDLLILDVMLPDGDGFQLAKKVRGRWDIPILFLTAKASESDRITGFEVGADDYVTKPFSPKELVLRVSAILKRTNKKEAPATGGWILGKGNLKIEEQSHRVWINNSEVYLTAAEWKILTCLAQNPGIVISRDRILGECLDYMAEGSERTVDTHVKNIRKKLGDPRWVETVREYGYRFSGERS
ncbi:MAG TPA: response regulator transcription factor [Spirochaetota bacterium]|nr:response regulator transcription factor [Spirochaetota bacterium]